MMHVWFWKTSSKQTEMKAVTNDELKCECSGKFNSIGGGKTSETFARSIVSLLIWLFFLVAFVGFFLKILFRLSYIFAKFITSTMFFLMN